MAYGISQTGLGDLGFFRKPSLFGWGFGVTGSDCQYLYSVVKIDFGLAAAKLRETKQNVVFFFFDSIDYCGSELIGRLDFSMVGNCSSSDLWISLAPTVMVTSLVN